MPGYQTTVVGIDEARIDAYYGLFTDAARLAALNTALALSPNLAVTASADNFLVGDPDTWPTDAPQTFLACITGGGKLNSRDMDFGFKYVGTQATVSAFRLNIYTSIAIYIHPDVFAATDSTWANVKLQTNKRERLRARLCDWARADVLMTEAGCDITLASQEYSASGDNLVAHAPDLYVSITKGRFAKSFAGQWGVYGAQIAVGCMVQ